MNIDTFLIDTYYKHSQQQLYNYIKIMSNKNPPYKQMYYVQKSLNPVNLNKTSSNKNLSLTTSIGANQNPSAYQPFSRNKAQQLANNIMEVTNARQIARYEHLQSQMNNISTQNMLLRQQNQHLKKELKKNKNQNGIDNTRNSEKYITTSHNSSNDLRGTIKKQVGEMKQLKLKFEMLSKQCNIYEQIIETMDEKIKKLTYDNNKKICQIDELRAQLPRYQTLKEKANTVMGLYNDMESKFNIEQLDWMKWKQNWLYQKDYYLNRIKELQRSIEKNYRDKDAHN